MKRNIICIGEDHRTGKQFSATSFINDSPAKTLLLKPKWNVTSYDALSTLREEQENLFAQYSMFIKLFLKKYKYPHLMSATPSYYDVESEWHEVDFNRQSYIFWILCNLYKIISLLSWGKSCPLPELGDVDVEWNFKEFDKHGVYAVKRTFLLWLSAMPMYSYIQDLVLTDTNYRCVIKPEREAPTKTKRNCFEFNFFSLNPVIFIRNLFENDYNWNDLPKTWSDDGKISEVENVLIDRDAFDFVQIFILSRVCKYFYRRYFSLLKGRSLSRTIAGTQWVVQSMESVKRGRQPAITICRYYIKDKTFTGDNKTERMKTWDGWYPNIVARSENAKNIIKAAARLLGYPQGRIILICEGSGYQSESLYAPTNWLVVHYQNMYSLESRCYVYRNKKILFHGNNWTLIAQVAGLIAKDATDPNADTDVDEPDELSEIAAIS